MFLKWRLILWINRSKVRNKVNKKKDKFKSLNVLFNLFIFKETQPHERVYMTM